MLTLYQVFRKKARTLIRVSKLLYLDKKELLMSPRSRVPLAIVAAVLVLVLAVPWSRRTIGSEAMLKPADAASVQAPEEGVVTKVLVHEGQDVQRGQPLFSMSSPAVDAEARRSLAQRDMHARKSSANQALANAGMTFQSASRASAAQTALDTAEYRQGFLMVRSPIAGRVLTARPEDLEGRYVAAGFNLADVGDCRKMVAEVPVSERLLEYLQDRLSGDRPGPDPSDEELLRRRRDDIAGDDGTAPDRGRERSHRSLGEPRPFHRAGCLRQP